MEDFRIIYRILKAIVEYEKAEEPSLLYFEPERLKTTAENRDRLILKLVDAGYIKGIYTIDDIDGQTKPVIIWNRSTPTITVEGMQYLEENSMMRKVANALKGIGETLH